MKRRLHAILCDPIDKSDLQLANIKYDEHGDIFEGLLVSASGRTYPIRNGIPRFVEDPGMKERVQSFGDEWNFFNFELFKLNWLQHTVKNTFGSADFFRGKVIVDAGAGSGMQALWMSQAGAEYVISLELSHSVDGILKQNLARVDNVDILQCSIDQPPLKDRAIKGLVICHNVIHHTPSVEETARALWQIVSEGGEFVFNCYPKNDRGLVRKLRFALYLALRGFLSRRSFTFRLNYARVMSVLRFVPVLGVFLEKSGVMGRGVVPPGPGFLRRAYVASVLNTFDCFGGHAYQHHKTDEEICQLVHDLQPNPMKVLNTESYFSRPQPIGCALRLIK